jgi:subtilisin-like proprotein convertase family protein
VLSDWGIRLRLLGVLLGASWAPAALIVPAMASAAIFTNPAPIAIPNSGNATPFPSTIEASGLGPTLEDVNVYLSGFTHIYPADVDILVQSPSGQSVVLMSDAPNAGTACGQDVSELELDFDDSAPGPIPPAAPLATGTYKPTNYDGSGCFDFGLDEIPPATGTAMSAFNGTNPNGTWRLFVSDDVSPEPGAISGGWEIEIAPTNDFELGKVTKKKNKGIALITVNVPGPGTLALTGTGIKPQRRAGGATASKAVAAAGPVTLTVKAKGKKRAKLYDRGKVKVKANITFTPPGGYTETDTRTIKLVKN